MNTLTVTKKVLQTCAVSLVLAACGSQEPVISSQAGGNPFAILASHVQSAFQSAGIGGDEKQEGATEIAQALSRLPYYGNREVCEMSAEQAQAYAQLLADGMAGKSSLSIDGVCPREFFPLMDRVMTDPTAPWDLPFSVMDVGGSYKTTRSWAILADFAGDGNPYLLAYDPEKTTASCTIWGWSNNSLYLIANSENWQGRTSLTLTADPQTGIVSADSSSSYMTGAMGNSYLFEDGYVTMTSSWSQKYLQDTDQIVWTEDGVSTYYTQAEWQAFLENQPELPQSEQSKVYDWPSLEDTMANGTPLADMLDALNAYAVSAGG